MPALIILVNGTPVPSHPIRQAETKVGRSRLNDVQVLDERVSRFHFVVRQERARYRVLNVSKQAITVNGATVAEAGLEHGDEIGFGQTAARFVADAPLDATER